MSALVRYFLSKGKTVGGYDRTPTELTRKLEEEGASIHYEDNVEGISQDFLDAQTTLVVYTPAIPAEHKELTFSASRVSKYKNVHKYWVCSPVPKEDCVWQVPMVKQQLQPWLPTCSTIHTWVVMPF